MKNSTDNKSLFLYTGLIFAVAILMIIISFFGQKNLEKQYEEFTGAETSANSIVEKTAQLSEENMILLEATDTLNKKNKELEANNQHLLKTVETLENQINTNNLMVNIFENINNKKYQDAAYDFSMINMEYVSEEQMDFYNYLKNRLRKIYRK